MLPNAGNQYIKTLQDSFQYSDTLSISNDTTVKQYGGVIDQHKTLVYVGNAVEIVVSEVCEYFYATIFQLFSIIGDISIWYCDWLLHDYRH